MQIFWKQKCKNCQIIKIIDKLSTKIDKNDKKSSLLLHKLLKTFWYW